MIAEIICNKEKKHFRTVICTPKVRHFWRCIFFYRKKFFIFLVRAKLTLNAVFVEK